MAAGLSRRAAPHNKLLLRNADGAAMVARVADAVLASRARPVLVITGHQDAAVRAALAGRALDFVTALDFAVGLSATLRAGVASLPREAAGVLVCLGDMPLVTTALLDRLIAASEEQGAPDIVVPVYRGERGNPVLWKRRFFAELMTLEGDRGARDLLLRHALEVGAVEAGDRGVLVDFDEGGGGWSA